jgi:hypothetical protein
MSTAGMRTRHWGGRTRRRSLRSEIQRSLVLVACAVMVSGVFAGFFEIGRSTRSAQVVPQSFYAPQVLRAKSLPAGIPDAPIAAAPIPAPVPSEPSADAGGGSASAAPAVAAASVGPAPAAPRASVVPPRTSSSVRSQEPSPARSQSPSAAAHPPEKHSAASQPAEKPSAGGGGSFDSSE